MDLDAYCTDLARRARAAARLLATVTGERKERWLKESADALEARSGPQSSKPMLAISPPPTRRR